MNSGRQEKDANTSKYVHIIIITRLCLHKNAVFARLHVMKIFSKIHNTCKPILQILAILVLGITICLDESVYANFVDEISNSEFVEQQENEQNEDQEQMGADEAPPENCWGLEFSEVYTYYTSGEKKTDQFIELVNTSEESLNLSGCSIEYSILYANDDSPTLKEKIALTGEVASEEYWVWFASDEQSLTKDPSGAVTLRLIGTTGEEIDTYTYSGQKEGRSWAWFGVNEDGGEEDWQLTYALTPGSTNKKQDCKDPTKVLNPETGRCVNPPESESDDEEEDSTHLSAQCEGLKFSEILTYYEDAADEQFIELYNSTSEKIKLDGCKIRYKSKTIALTGEIDADGYLAHYTAGVTLTKNPTKSNELKLIDVNGVERDSLVYYHGQKKGVAYAQFDYLWTGEENWQQTYAPTPGVPNVYQEYKTCPQGKVINEATGNCVNVSSDAVLEPCPPGKYRNPLTNRCKSILASTSELKPCPEGYERNPETNRCRKIVNNDGADYAFMMDTSEGNTNFVAFAALGAVGVMGVSYVTWQFRHEIAKGYRKVAEKLGRKKMSPPT